VRQSAKPEDAAFRRPGRRATVEQVQAVVTEVLGQDARAFQRQRKGGWEQAVLAKVLVEQAGLTQREAAGAMGLTTGAAVSIQLRRLQQALPQDAQLRRQVSKIESHLAITPKG